MSESRLNSKENSVITVGISGVTCGGKSSLAKKLTSIFEGNVICIGQDNYYHSDEAIYPTVKVTDSDGQIYQNWDAVECLDMEKMTQEVKEAKKKFKGLLIVEGFSIFQYAPLSELCDLRYYITLTLEDCLTRRNARLDRDPPDPPGYFLNVAWPAHLARMEEMSQKCHEKIIYIDGTSSLETNAQLIIRDVKMLLDR